MDKATKCWLRWTGDSIISSTARTPPMLLYANGLHFSWSMSREIMDIKMEDTAAFFYGVRAQAMLLFQVKRARNGKRGDPLAQYIANIGLFLYFYIYFYIGSFLTLSEALVSASDGIMYSHMRT